MGSRGLVKFGLALVLPLAATLAHAQEKVLCDIAKCYVQSLSGGASGPLDLGDIIIADNWAPNQINGLVEDVLQSVGLEPNFVVIETAKVGNAAALIHQQKRILAYNPDWIKRIGDADKWSMYGLLCHEIGHHLQGHTLLDGGSKPPTELEADKFAGFVLANMGASEDEAISLWNTLPVEASKTHPGRADRVSVVRQGWSRGRRPAERPAEQAPAGAYILQDSSNRQLGANDVQGMSKPMMRLARNEIFARHGYAFDSPDLQRYFGQQPWYRPIGKKVTLSGIEKQNVAMLKAIEDGGGDASADGIIFPHSGDVRLTVSEVEALDRAQRRLARNEIFARRGYVFSDPKLAEYFKQRRWYRPVGKSVRLSDIENFNVDLLRSME